MQLEIFGGIFFSFSFRQARFLVWNLNSKDNLNLELFPEGGVPVFVLYFIQIQTAISQLIYKILQKYFQLSTPFYQIFQKKLGRLKNLRNNAVGKHDVVTEYFKTSLPNILPNILHP